MSTITPDAPGQSPERTPKRAPVRTFLNRYLRPAMVLTLLLTIVTGLIYPGIVTGLAQICLSLSGEWQPGAQSTASHRLELDRAVLDVAQVLPWPTLGDRQPGTGTP